MYDILRSSLPCFLSISDNHRPHHVVYNLQQNQRIIRAKGHFLRAKGLAQGYLRLCRRCSFRLVNIHWLMCLRTHKDPSAVGVCNCVRPRFTESIEDSPIRMSAYRSLASCSVKSSIEPSRISTRGKEPRRSSGHMEVRSSSKSRGSSSAIELFP